MIGELSRALVVDGATIRWDVVGEGPDLVLVHGNGANFAWWGPVVDALHGDYRLTFLDLSGHGDSDHRAKYEPSSWIEEVRAVMNAAGVVDPIVIGHSMGGRVVVSLAAQGLDDLAGIMLFDTSIRPPSRYRDFRLVERKPAPVYDSKDAAVARFRLKPEQPHPGPEIMLPLAEHSMKRTVEGWTWKYDPRALTRFTDAEIDAAARRVAVPVGFVYATGSTVVDDALADYVVRTVPAPVRTTRIEDAFHHVILDRPGPCARLIDDFADWLGGIAERGVS